MANPDELLHSAARNKKRRPAELHREMIRDIPVENPPREGAPLPPRPHYQLHTGHSAYNALMRSHDRVRPRIGR